MTNEFLADIDENILGKTVIELLLKDQTTGRNILWCTDDYKELGDKYLFDSEITPELITGDNSNVIKPRCVKSKEEQSKRQKVKAEVMTPTWLCNKMINASEENWFGRNHVFNKEGDKSWEENTSPVEFPEGKTVDDYINRTVMEITTGEGPFVVSRYDTVTADVIPLEKRIGVLDRKMRVISEFISTVDEILRKSIWIIMSLSALKHTYGYEWQGDNLMLTRENVFISMNEYYESIFGEQLPQDIKNEIAMIISWNFFQMDGLKHTIPMKDNIFVRIMNWDKNEIVIYKDLT